LATVRRRRNVQGTRKGHLCRTFWERLRSGGLRPLGKWGSAEERELVAMWSGGLRVEEGEVLNYPLFAWW
jgi:hypothetical protein